MLHISIKPEVIFQVFGFPVTNSLLTSSILLVLFLLVSIYFSMNYDSDSKPMFFLRWVLNGLYNLFHDINGKMTNSIFPLLGSMFLFILLANWMGLIPGVGSIVIKPAEEVHSEITEDATHAEEVLTDDHSESKQVAESKPVEEEEHHEAPTPLFRGATADLNMTLALALIAFFAIQYYGFKELGLSYLKKFINFKSPIDFFIGVLEIVSEFSKIISFAFRLFGNIFAGEVLLAVIAFLIPVLASFPFLLLEIFVGVIQALVFALLTSVFVQAATAKHH